MRMPNRIATIFVALSLVALAGCQTMGGSKDTGKKETVGQYIDDATISTRVKAAFAGDPDVKATEVQVETYKGVVQLSGFVSSKAAMDRAIELAKSVNGVKSVKNNMTLKQ